jgi:hypothetical protein
MTCSSAYHKISLYIVASRSCAPMVLDHSLITNLFTILLVLLWLVVLPARKDRYVPTHYDPTF